MQDHRIDKTIAFVKSTLAGAEPGHDWWHVWRVVKLSLYIARSYENVDLLVVQLGALLHDIADSKFHHNNEKKSPTMAKEFLDSLNLPAETIDHVLNIIRHISFRDSDTCDFNSLEFQIIQDADRLDALGAIGIARTFSYGGHKKREMYNPEIKPKSGMSSEEYKNTAGPTINHFYEKLLLLKDRMNTPEAKKIADGRHRFMLDFLDRFYGEWDFPGY